MKGVPRNKPKKSTTTGAATTATLYRDNTFAATNQSLASSYTAVAKDGFGRADTNTITVTLSNPVSFSYDANGNLKGDGRRTFFYDNENQLLTVIVTNGVNNSTKVDFQYDARLRRRVRKDYNWQSGAFALTNEVHYVYDGLLVLQERDSSNNPAVTYTRGADMSGTMQGAGGIGGLLARTDNVASTHAYYHADGNGNITAMTDGQQVIVAKYLYDAFGNPLGQSGKLADVNLIRFSSKEWHGNSETYRYEYRPYDPNLQRWVNRDPLEDAELSQGTSLYAYVVNDPVNLADSNGLSWIGKISSKGIVRVLRTKTAHQLIRKGRNLIASSKKDVIRAVEKSEPGKKCVFHTRDKTARRFGPHGQPKPRGGNMSHVFDASQSNINALRNTAAALTAAAYLGQDSTLADVIDFVNPLSLGQDVLDIVDAINETIQEAE